MKKLGLLDDTFLRLESRRQPLHIGVLMLFEPPADSGADFVMRLAERLRQSTQAAAPFNYRLVERRGMHYWEEADDFDLAHHFVHTALPKPGRIRELLALVSRVHCAHLDRAYPLWRMYLVEGLEDGRVAVYMKMHHSMVDGIAGMHMLLKTMSTRARESLKLPAPWEVQTIKSSSQPLPVPTPFGSIPALHSLAREGFRSVGPVLREIISTVGDLREHNPNLVLAGQAPACLLNNKVSATRRFAAQSYSTARMRAVAQAFDTSLNDVVLAMCSGALRRYLSDLDQLPEESLVAGVPVSVRRHENDAGNEVAFAVTSLATNITDPGERLRAIRDGMSYNKERIKRLTPGQLLAYAATMLLPGTLASLTGLAKNKALGSVVISHVPGPRRDMYWQGMRLCGMYPVSLVIDYGALNITVVSRHDAVDFGLIACRKSVPQMQRMLDYLEDALAELEATLKPRASAAGPSKPARRPAAKSAAKTATRARKKSASATRRKSEARPKARPKSAMKQTAANKAAVSKPAAKKQAARKTSATKQAGAAQRRRAAS